MTVVIGTRRDRYFLMCHDAWSYPDAEASIAVRPDDLLRLLPLAADA
jgi:hypothetical protein